MIKILGACLVLISTTWSGFEAAKSFSDRTKQLRQLKVALKSLEAEMMFGHTPLKEAAEGIAKQIPGPLSKLFLRFSEVLGQGRTSVKAAWETALNETWKLTALKQGEHEVLSHFGETLGQHDLYSQQKHIQLALAHLEKEEAEAVDRQTRYEKMLKSLGFLAGMLLIILFM
ncbi:stage III sporulation protein SpoAB [Bacillus lacus]|uniref:Stage III sporulation protein SpoAB n=1 Tax=Metabacillus lacus TaxID=1983721 RepID=A0A7X2LZ94_9BACI|nr:stage III sporulation protein SpoIIIAB [Metabacillus lacus]MRX73176.1 stage III sporulation protein SpoAB [Metabacillus lacus]